MYFPQATFPNTAPKCRVVKKITGSGTFYCLKPATVVLMTSVEQPLVICLGCARELAHEILESVPNGKRDARRDVRAIAARKAQRPSL
jgi:hypothetical protein